MDISAVSSSSLLLLVAHCTLPAARRRRRSLRAARRRRRRHRGVGQALADVDFSSSPISAILRKVTELEKNDGQSRVPLLSERISSARILLAIRSENAK